MMHCKDVDTHRCSYGEPKATPLHLKSCIFRLAWEGAHTLGIGGRERVKPPLGFFSFGKKGGGSKEGRGWGRDGMGIPDPFFSHREVVPYPLP